MCNGLWKDIALACYDISREEGSKFREAGKLQRHAQTLYSLLALAGLIGISLQLSFLKGQPGKMGRKYPAAHNL